MSQPRVLLFIVVLLLLVICTAGCLRPRSSRVMSAEHQESHALLCSDVDARKCRKACPFERLSPNAHARCLIDLRFAGDVEARDLARSLYESKRIVPAISGHSQIEGYKGELVSLLPAIPIGEQRHHLSWLDESLNAFDEFIAQIGARAPNEVTFDSRPKALVFFQTAESRYPSAFVVNDNIAYNLKGPLHIHREEMHHTFFHELFHLNDNRRHWAETSLDEVFARIITRCGDNHDCYEPFAPYSTTVTNGTYYPFDARTRDVREYGAELAVRYFLEHDAILSNRVPLTPPFKCQTPDNAEAWTLMANEFFGGLDLTPDC